MMNEHITDTYKPYMNPIYKPYHNYLSAPMMRTIPFLNPLRTWHS